LKVFFKALNDEESKIIPVLEKDNIGWILRCAVNELDWYYSNLNEPTEKEQEQLYIIQLGTARLIKLALESRGCFDAPVLTFRRQKDMSMKAIKNGVWFRNDPAWPPCCANCFKGNRKN